MSEKMNYAHRQTFTKLFMNDLNNISGGPLPPAPHDWQKQIKDWQQRAIAAEAERQRLWELFKDESDQDSEVREILKQFDTSDSYCYEPTPELAKKCLAAKESAEQSIAELRKSLREIKLFVLTTTEPSQSKNLCHIVRMCIDAGITEKLSELCPHSEITEGNHPTEGFMVRCKLCGSELQSTLNKKASE